MTATVLAMLPKGPRKRRLSLSLNMYPSLKSGRAWLYAAGFDTGVTKLGRSRSPRLRLKAHSSSSSGSMLWCHLFQSLDERLISQAEGVALVLAARVGERVNDSEWFRGLSRDDAIKACREAIAETQLQFEDRQAQDEEGWYDEFESWEGFGESGATLLEEVRGALAKQCTKQLAKTALGVGCSYATALRIRDGKTDDPGFLTVQALAECLGVVKAEGKS